MRNRWVSSSLIVCAIAVGAARCSSNLTLEEAIAHLGAGDGDGTGVSLASDGHRIAAAWAETREGHTDVYAAMSETDGETFGPAVRVNDIEGDARVSGEQPPRVALGKDVVVVWASRANESSRIRMARSTDGGKSFLPAVTLHQEGLTGARGWQSVAIGPDGVIHALWLDGRHAGAGMAHHHDSSGAKAMPEAAASPRQDIMHASWAANGSMIETEVAPNVCFCCKTSIAVGPDHAFYAAWRHIYPTSMRDIAVARSTDAGRTFDAPTRVSLDNWQLTGCPDDGPAMVVDAANVIHVVWPTLVPGTPPSKGIFYAYSTDSGKSFSPRQRLDDPQGTSAAHPAIALDGRDVIVVWDDLSPAKERRVRLRRLSQSDTAAWAPEASAGLLVSAESPASYPSVTVAGGKIVVAWTGEGATHSEIRVRRAVK
ncbi:MAG TPA: sialidase family protein [Vicinamibacterales bacterium]|nr:sialidase family protein [Vicinamibacterales bacterium]